MKAEAKAKIFIVQKFSSCSWKHQKLKFGRSQLVNAKRCQLNIYFTQLQRFILVNAKWSMQKINTQNVPTQA